MADPKKYISVFNDGTNDLYIKDAEAQAAIADLQKSVTGAMHYIGVSSTAIADGDGAAKGPWTIDGVTFIASGTPAEGQKLLASGDVAIYGELEFVWNATAQKWKEFGSTGSLKSLAFKDASDIETGGSTSQNLVVTTITGTDGTETVSKVTKTEKKLGTTTITGTDGTETVSKVTKTEKKLGKTSVGSASSWNDGALPSMTYDQNTEKLTFSAGTKPSLTITATDVADGSLVATDTVGAGDTLIEGVSISDKTVAKVASAATTVATGSLVATDAASGAGDTIIEGVSISDKTVAKVASAATTVATGSVANNGTGSSVVTAVSTTIQNKPTV